jgi:hypothetical protein
MIRFIFLFFISIQLINANPLELGKPFPLSEWQDQFDENQQITDSTKKIFFISDMPASKILHGEIENKESDFLTRHNSIIFSDIHRMPTLISKFVAIPKMKGYKYRMLLIRDEETGKLFPKEPEKITAITLDQKKIIKIEFISNLDELKSHFTNSIKKK